MTIIGLLLLCVPLVALAGLGAYAIASYDREMRAFYRELRKDGEE